MTQIDIQDKMIQSVVGIVKRCIHQAMSARETIRAVYLFGSVLDENRFKSGSDIDLAFLLENSEYSADSLTASYDAYHISTRVSSETGHRTDVVILNEASVETAYQVITTGKLLYEKNPGCGRKNQAADNIQKHLPDFENFIQQIRLYESQFGEQP